MRSPESQTPLQRIYTSYAKRSGFLFADESFTDFLKSLEDPSIGNQFERIIVFSLGPLGNPYVELLSLLVSRLDVVEIILDKEGYEISTHSYAEGTYTNTSTTHHRIKDPGLITFSISRHLETVYSDEPIPTEVWVIHPEKDPVLTETFVGAINQPFDLFFETPTYNQSILRLENAARNCFVSSQEALNEWKLQHVAETEISNFENQVLLRSQAASKISSQQKPPIEDPNKYETFDHRVLIVSYFALPTTLVSTQRLSYWHQTLSSIAAESGVDLDVVWLSATSNAETFPKNRVIKDRGNHLISPELRNPLARAIDKGVPTLGISWLSYVQEEVTNWDDRFDTVIISVGPFGYLGLGNFFKDLWGAQIIYDFRDPYGGDPRMVFTKEQRAWIDNHERESISRDDIIVSVNSQCLKAVAPDKKNKRAIVNNGYDEATIDKVQNSVERTSPADGLIKFVYCGTIFRNLGIDEFLKTLSINHHRLLHFGRDQTNSKILESHEAAERKGFVADRSELIKEMFDCDAGILRLGGEATTGTTKIFDYIACDLDIIIITDGKLKEGAVHDLTDGLEGIFWIKNNPDALQSFMNSYEPTRSRRRERDNFSRSHQASILLNLITSPNLVIER